MPLSNRTDFAEETATTAHAYQPGEPSGEDLADRDTAGEAKTESI